MKIIPNEMSAVEKAVHTAFPPYQELDYTSLSKAPVQEAGSDFETMLPVSLDPKWASDYNTILYTRKNLTSIKNSEDNARQKAAADGVADEEDSDDEAEDDGTINGQKKKRSKAPQGPQMIRESYTQLSNYLAQQSAAINIGTAQARMILFKAQDIAIASSIEEKAEISNEFEDELKYKIEKMSDSQILDAASSKYLGNMKAGNTHVIRPSSRYPGGYDILFTSNPGALLSVPPQLGLFKIEYSRFDPTLARMNAPGGHLTLPSGRQAVNYSRAIIEGLFGAGAASAKTASQRIVKVLPIDFDFQKLLKDAEKELQGVPVNFRLLAAAVPKFPQIFPQAFNKFFSLVAVLDGHDLAINEKSKGILEPTISEDAVTLQPRISFTIALNLPEPIVSFITQTPPGGRIPLAPLHVWATVWASAYLTKMALKKGESAERGISIKSVPKYVLSASRTEELVKARKDRDFYTETGRSNDDHLYVSNIGTMNYCPKSTDLVLDNAKNYESLMEQALQVSYDAGAPLMIHQVEEANAVFGVNSPEYRNKIRAYKESIKKYAGSLQSYSWDYNCILHVALGAPDKLNATKLAGAAKPDELSITDYLRRDFPKAMQLLFTRSLHDKKQVTPESFGQGHFDLSVMLETDMFQFSLPAFYKYLLEEKAVPDFQELVNRAAKDLEITNLSTDEAHKPYEWGFDQGGRFYLYKNFLTADLKAAADLEGDIEKQWDAIMWCFRRALEDSSGVSTSNLSRYASLNNFPIEDDPHYFNPKHTLAEFKNVYNYLGGRVFYHLMKAFTEVDKRKFMVINPSNPRHLLDFPTISEEVMPLAVIFSKYIPNSEDIYQKGDEIAERNNKNEGITAEDIRVPGSKAPNPETGAPGMQMFPHQVEGHKYLRNAPKFAVLDIAPGGGKTILVLSDIACLVRDRLCEKPLIGCPTGLVRNWVEDLHKITQGQWNVIPITAQILKRWTYERLSLMIKEAPRNTVCVVGYSALSKSNSFNIILGNHVERVSGVLEFVKKFGFDYVALDESHRVKNASTATHQTIKQLCTASNVKFVRLATGTLISNKLTDVVGQAAMFNSQIFRTAEEYEAENHTWAVGPDGKDQWVWKPDTPQLARKQLARHAAVITFKRKEWAFMLPLPQEEFIPVDMSDDGREGQAHQMMYEAVLKSTIDEIKAEMKRDGSDLARLLKGEKDDGDGEGDGGGEAKRKRAPKQAPSDAEKIDLAVDTIFDKDGNIKNQGMDDSTLEELSATLGVYIQRLEMLLTDPLGDEFGKEYFGNINENYVSKKVRKVIERIKLNFEMNPWKAGHPYKKANPNDPADKDLVMPDVCDYDGKRYVLLPAEGAQKSAELYYAPYISNITPDKDSRWKEEAYGKVIVFCRYTRSVNAIYAALQKTAPELAKVSVIFHGEVEGDKWAGLDSFKSTKIDPTLKTPAQILIANEQAISEGHNLQMASRLIRVEAPWAPGELDQASARIFRPDPTGKFGREHIYLDWILTDRTLEVAKMGRLISKMVTKAQFDEANNPHYESMNDIQLEMKSMGIEALQERSTLDDIEPYTSAYRRLAQLVGREFRQMRETKLSKMFDIEPEPMFSDAKTIAFVPYVPNMKIPDRSNLGLTVLTEYIQDTENPDVQAILHDPKSALTGRYVHTEMGNGVVTTARGKGRLTSVTVLIDGTDEPVPFEPGLIYVSPKLTREVVKKLPRAPKISDKQKKELEKEKIRAQKKAEQEEKKLAERKRREEQGLKRLGKLNQLNNTPTGKTPKTPSAPKVAAPKKPKAEKPQPQHNNNVEFFPTVINGFLAIDANVEDASIDLSHNKFVEVEPYAYFKVLTRGEFDAVLDFIESKYYVKKATWTRITNLRDSFVGVGKRAKFDIEQAPMKDFKNFFNMYKTTMKDGEHYNKHTMAATKDETPNRKPELKLYPMVLKGTLYLMADMATNPVMKRVVGKAIPGAKELFHISGLPQKNGGSLWYRFASSNSMKDLNSMIDELVRAGFTWTNEAEYKAELNNLKKNHGLKR